jgi:hypothetical protein
MSASEGEPEAEPIEEFLKACYDGDLEKVKQCLAEGAVGINDVCPHRFATDGLTTSATRERRWTRTGTGPSVSLFGSRSAIS